MTTAMVWYRGLSNENGDSFGFLGKRYYKGYSLGYSKEFYIQAL